MRWSKNTWNKLIQFKHTHTHTKTVLIILTKTHIIYWDENAKTLTTTKQLWGIQYTNCTVLMIVIN